MVHDFYIYMYFNTMKIHTHTHIHTYIHIYIILLYFCYLNRYRILVHYYALIFFLFTITFWVLSLFIFPHITPASFYTKLYSFITGGRVRRNRGGRVRGASKSGSWWKITVSTHHFVSNCSGCNFCLIQEFKKVYDVFLCWRSN